MVFSSTACPRSYQARRLWLIDAQVSLDAFDRLTNKGMSERKAARRVGLDRAAIRQMRARSVSLEAAFQSWSRRER